MGRVLVRRSRGGHCSVGSSRHSGFVRPCRRLRGVDGNDTDDPPPLKWSALRYGFRAKEDHDAEEETQARGDCCEAAPGGMCWCRRGRALPTRYVTRSTSSLSGGLRGTDLLRPGSPEHARAGQRMKEITMRKTILMAGVLALSASMAHAQGRDRDDDEDGWRDRREYRAERGRDYDEDHRSWHHG